MGNALSENDEDGKQEFGIDADDDVSDQDENGESETRPTTDLCHLFGDSASLRAAATKVKEKIPENVILQHNSNILQWLETRLERQEDSISMAQFCEMLMDKGVERSDAVKAFHQFDCDGSGVAEVQTMMDTLEQYSSRSALGELGKSVRILQSCALMPGFVDVYAGITDPVEKHGNRILQYLLRNRTETQSLPFPYLNSFNIVCVMRSAVLTSLLNAATEDVKDMDGEKDITEMEKRTIQNSFSNIEVSSNSSEAHHLRHNSMFWQSDGAARSHFIRLRIKPNIILKLLSIGVASSDESYMPELVSVSVGSSLSRMKELKETKIEKHYSGRVVLLRNMKVHYPYVQINIKRCHVDGCDTRIHGIKAIGYKLVKEQGITVMDASALWFLQMLTSTINFNLPQSPALRTALLGHTKKALEYMPPLVLSPCSPDKPVFLSKHVLQEVERFAHQLSFSPDLPEHLSMEGMQVILCLNLARGSVAGLLSLLSQIIELPSLTLPCAELLCKAVSAKNACLERLGTPVPVTFVSGDGGPGGANAGPDILVDYVISSLGKARWSAASGVYLTDEGKTKCTLIFQTEQQVQLTKIKIQVAAGGKGPKRGLVFVYNADSVPELGSKFNADEHINYLSKYDFWREKEFEFSVQYRNAGLGGLPDNPVAYFCLDNDSDEIDVPTQWGAVGKYIIIKFLEARHVTATRLGIAGLKFFGLSKPVVLNTGDQKPLAVPDASKKPTCDLPEICSLVLNFAMEISSEQVKQSKGRGIRSQFEFLDLSELNLTQLWDLHLNCLKRAENEASGSKFSDLWRHCSILALQLTHGLIPVLANSKSTSEASRDDLFQQLCSIVNAQTPEVKETPTNLYAANKLKMIKQIIIDGAPLFFPEKSKKRVELFKLLQTVSDQSSMPSMSLVFQSLCQFFSSVDPRGLLELPSTLTEDFDATGTLELMRSLLGVACQEVQDLKKEASASRRLRLKQAHKEWEGSAAGKNNVGKSPAADASNSQPQTGDSSEETSVMSVVPSTATAANVGAGNEGTPSAVTTANTGASNEGAPSAVTAANTAATTYGTPTANAGRTEEAKGKAGETPPVENNAVSVTAVSDAKATQEIETTGTSAVWGVKPVKEVETTQDAAKPGEKAAQEPEVKTNKSAVSQANVGGGDDAASAAAAAAAATGGAGNDAAEEEAESGTEDEGRLVYLVMLAASLQTSLFSWLWQQLDARPEGEEHAKLGRILQTMMHDYTKDVAEKAYQFFEIFKTMDPEDLRAKVSKDEPSFLHIILRQLMLLLTVVVDKLDIETKVSLLQGLKKLVISVSDVAKANPDLFLDISSECWDKVDTEETVLRTWELESPHEYLNHSNVVQMFNCPGATKLVADFDPRCETERRYDYLEFTDSKGLKLRFDQKVGTSKWPRKVTFSGPYVHFIFHSDSSNTEWGYKFTMTAYGTPDMQNSWLSDLQLGLIKVLGQLSGATLSSNPSMPQESPMVGEDSSEQDILRSNLWTSLFRGGYMVGKLQRSLSGKFATTDDSRVHALLTEVVNVAAKRQPESAEDASDVLWRQANKLLAKCQKTDTSKAPIRVGGPKVDEAVTSLFAALVWHCQALREDTDKFLNNEFTSEVSDGLVQAYNVAESIRLTLASDRQKWNSQEDEEKDLNADPAELFSSKAMYLMKFAGLTKVQLRHEMRSKFYKQMMMKKAGNKQPVVWLEGMEKFPSFRLVMEFVQDPAWTPERVHLMLQERSKFASAISEVYMFASEMLRVLSNEDPFQITVVLYFRELSAYQHHFARHYADGLDGCGLGQEARVRQGYYSLLRRFVEAFRQSEGQPRDSKKAPAYDMLQCILLHFLDVEWQPYDLSFVHELQLPQLFMNFAKETVKMRDLCMSDVKDEEELEDYNMFMKWFSEITGDFGYWFSKAADIENKKRLKWFVARYSDVLDVEISCDGCGVTLPGRRYRCLQCVDMDLCTDCFSGGVEPKEHWDTHEIVHLVYKCNHCQGFITSTRIHCNQCDDFDLCLGCHVKQKFPPGHTDKHDVTKIPMVKLKTSDSSSSSLQAYVHQHAWLLYTSLTLSLSDAVYGQDAGLVYMDPDYFRVAAQLQQQCLDQAIWCLDQVSGEMDGEGENITSAEERRQKTFGMHSQERIMGLLGAVMPNELKKEHGLESGYNFCTEDFLNRLLRVSRGDKGHELNTQHLALRLMGRLLANSDTKMADMSTQRLISAEMKTAAPRVSGQQTVAHLFSFGAKAFERSGLEWACSVARMLEMLFGAHQWQLAIQQHISHCVQGLKHNLQPSSIFPMFVIAGFPEVLTTGALVDYTYYSLESQSGVVLKHFPERCQTLVVDLKTRKRHMVKDQLVTCRTDVADVLETESISKFVSFVTEAMSQIQAGDELSVETLWVLSLALKVLNRCFQSETVMSAVGRKIFSGSFVQFLVSLGCKGTGLNQGWLLKDLEVLSLIWYTHDGSTSKSKYNSLKKNLGMGEKKKKKRKKSHWDKVHNEGTDSDDMSDAGSSTDDLKGAHDSDDDDEDYDEDDKLDYITDSSSSSSSSMKPARKARKAGSGSDDDAASDLRGKLDRDDDYSDEDSTWMDALTGFVNQGKSATPPPSASAEKDGKKEEEEKEEEEKKEEAGGATAVVVEEKDAKDDAEDWLFFANLDPKMKRLLEAMHAKFDIPYIVLQAVCSMNDGDQEGIFNSIVDNFGEENEKLSNFLKKWKNESSDQEQKEASSNESSSIDTGIMSHPSANKAKRVLETAVSERGDNPQNLFQQQEVLAREINERQRGKSAQLLKKELEKHGRSGSREYLYKVNLAMCVLYARHTLTSLLAHWPDNGPPINSSLMGCKDVKQIPSVLDLLHKMDSQFFFSKVVDKVIHLCDASSLVPIAFTAAQFMEELTLQAVTCESTHSYTQADKKKGQIQLPGASYLTVTFDSRCNTAEDDLLKFSNSQKLGGNVHVFSGSSPAKWSSFSLPGDSLFYRFCLEDYDSSMAECWGYKFTVTPGICDSFETGHTILKAVLSSTVARSLPLGQLWTSLVYVACKQPGTQRLKALNLMLKIVALQGKAGCADQKKARPDIDLTLLKPLWELYRDMTREDADQGGSAGASPGSDESSTKAGRSSSSTFQSVVVRALTDLFLHAENLATEWEITEPYLVALLDVNDICLSIGQGLMTVAALGLQIGHPNMATDLVRKIRLMSTDNKFMSALKSGLTR